MNFIAAVHPQLRGGPCRVNASDLLLRSTPDGRRGRLPDASVTCTQGDGRSMSPPVVLVEVLSPESEYIDQRENWLEYQRLPSLQHYLPVAQDPVAVQHYRREPEGWHYSLRESLDMVVVLEPPGVTLRLADLDEGVRFEPLAAD